MNVAETVRRAAQRAPTAPALIGSAGAVSWAELDARVDAVAAALQARHLPASANTPARVAIALPQTVEFAVVFFGVLRAGLVAVPVNPGYTDRELRHVVSDSGAALLVATSPRVEVLTCAPADLDAPATPAPGAGTEDDLAVLLYTSGTSGSPKAAMLTHRALLANQRQVGAVTPQPIGPDDVVLLALPLFHVFGLNAGLVAVAYHGASCVVLDRFEPAAALRAIADNRVTVVGAVPPMYAALLPALAEPAAASALETVRLAVSGGAPLAPDVARRFQALTGKTIVQGYGLTETAPVLTMGRSDPASIGRPVPGVELRLVAADGSVVAELTADGPRAPGTRTASAPEGAFDGGEPGVRRSDALDFIDDDAFAEEPGTDPGEIVVRGENVFRGYWPDGRGGPDAAGWWATGDVAYAGADGELYLVDRLTDLVIVNGFNVYPEEIEQVLLAHPGIAEAAVVGVPDPTTGEAVHAFIVPAGGGASFDELRDHCGRNLARYKCPTSFEIVDQLPRSAIGKVRKGSLRDPSTASTRPTEAVA